MRSVDLFPIFHYRADKLSKRSVMSVLWLFHPWLSFYRAKTAPSDWSTYRTPLLFHLRKLNATEFDFRFVFLPLPSFPFIVLPSPLNLCFSCSDFFGLSRGSFLLLVIVKRIPPKFPLLFPFGIIGTRKAKRTKTESLPRKEVYFLFFTFSIRSFRSSNRNKR
jgi:hypothetical protein